MEASTNVSAQKDFYQKLLWHELYVLTADQTGSEEAPQVSEETSTIRLVAFEEGQIPVFTSVNRIFDKGVVKGEVPYLAIKGQDLFEVAKGATFVLNPYSDHVKELFPPEIEMLMNGTIYDEIDEQEKESAKIQAFNQIFDRACKKQEGLVLLEGYRRKDLNETEKEMLEESIKDFHECLGLFPDHWQSMTMMAKSLQRLERHTEALEQLERALKIELEHHMIPMEASLEAMHLNDIGKAIRYSEESLKRNPDSFAVMGNHAMNLLIAERDVEAKETIDQAIKLQPNDTVNRNIESMILDVLTGKRKRPTFEDTIQ